MLYHSIIHNDEKFIKLQFLLSSPGRVKTRLPAVTMNSPSPISTSPSSYHTAPSTPPSPMAINSAMERPAWKPIYRPAVPVSKEIANLCHIYMDEQLCTHPATRLRSNTYNI